MTVVEGAVVAAVDVGIVGASVDAVVAGIVVGDEVVVAIVVGGIVVMGGSVIGKLCPQTTMAADPTSSGSGTADQVPRQSDTLTFE